MAFDEICDLLIIGSGGASMTAALLAKQNGATPLILEKSDKIGGSTSLSGGVLWMPNNSLMAREGIADSPEDAWTYLEACADGASSPRRRRAFLDHAPQVADFLEARGMQWYRSDGWSDYHVGELAGGVARGRTLEAKMFDLRKLGAWADRLRVHQADVPVDSLDSGRIALNGRTLASKLTFLRVAIRILRNRLGARLAKRGTALQARLLQMALRQGIDIRTSTPLIDLIEEDGRITGAIVGSPAGPRRIGARQGVLLNVGGFSHNRKMRVEYQPDPATTAYSLANPGDTGEALQVAMQHGAATDIMDLSWWVPVSQIAPNVFAPHTFDLAKPHAIIVDGDGCRYTNEAASYVALGLAMYERHKTAQAVPSWFIVDSQYRRKYRWGCAAYPAGKPPRAWIDSGYMIEAHSVDDLARQCGVSPVILGATIDRYNALCATGKDEDFGKGETAYHRFWADPTQKPNPTMGPLDKPPYYAVRLYPGDVGTAGGLVTDEHARVLRDDGTAIDGLYASGNATASVVGRSYPGAGASIAASMVFGFIAAAHATEAGGHR
jgi:3-oxosteroid 1-dehydrogenase